MRESFYLTCRVIVSLDAQYSVLSNLTKRCFKNIPILNKFSLSKTLTITLSIMLAIISFGFMMLNKTVKTIKNAMLTINKLGLILGFFATLTPQLLLTCLMKESLVENLSTSSTMLIRFLGLIIFNVSIAEFYASTTKISKMAVRINAIFGAVLGLYLVYFYMIGIASYLSLTLGLLLIPNIMPLINEAIKYLKKNPKDIMYDLKRKDMLMEKDSKIYFNLITGRLWTYIYDCYKTGLTYVQHMDIIRKIIPERFGFQFPWCGGRIYQQTSHNNKAIVDGYETFVMSSSSYAAMSKNSEVLEYAIEKARITGPNYGSYAVIGFNSVVGDLLKTLQKYYKREAAMVSASGYLACLNIVDV